MVHKRSTGLTRHLGLRGLGLALALHLGIVTPVGGNDRTDAAARQAPNQFQVLGMTAPSQRATLAAVVPARIARMVATEGSVVKANDLLITLDDSVQSAKTELARARAESSLSVELARVRLEHARRELSRLQRLHGSDHASSKEFSDAVAEHDVRRLELDLAVLDRAQSNRAYLREKEILDEYHLRAPFTGYVSQHHKHAGETVDQLEAILTLVRLDPLQVVVDSPLALASRVRAGLRVMVRPVDPRWTERLGTVVLASRVADGASQTFKVKLEVPNEDGRWMAGLKIIVDFGPAQHSERASDPARFDQTDVSQKAHSPKALRPSDNP